MTCSIGLMYMRTEERIKTLMYMCMWVIPDGHHAVHLGFCWLDFQNSFFAMLTRLRFATFLCYNFHTICLLRNMHKSNFCENFKIYTSNIFGQSTLVLQGEY